MQKNLFICLFLLVFFPIKSYSQLLNNFELIQGPVEEEKRSAFIKTVCSYEDYYIILRRIKNNYSVEKLNAKMMAIKAIDVTEFEEKDGTTRKFSNVMAFGDKIYLITNKYIKKKSSTTYYQEIDPDNFELKGDYKILNEVDLSQKKKTKTRWVIGGIGYSNLMAEAGEMANNNMIFSPDNKKMLTYTKTFDDRDGPDVISVLIQNENFEKEWENDSIALPYNSLLFDIETVKLDDSGNVFLTGLEYREKRKTKIKDNPNYSYHLIAIREQGKEIKDYEIKLKDKFITSCQFKLDKDKNIVVAGFYSDADASSVKGAFYLKINSETKEITNQSMKPFDFDFIVSGLSEREQEKLKRKEEKGKDVELMNFRLDDIVLNENGTYTLVAEHFNITTYTTYTPGASGRPGTYTTHYRYYYNDIIVVNFSSAGEINWANKINKYQVTTDDGGYYSSYVHSVKNNKLYIVYNDNPENLNISDPSKLKNAFSGRGVSQIIVEVDASGVISKAQLYKTERGDVIMRPKSCQASENGDIMLYCTRKKEYQFDLIKFK